MAFVFKAERITSLVDSETAAESEHLGPGTYLGTEKELVR